MLRHTARKKMKKPTKTNPGLLVSEGRSEQRCQMGLCPGAAGEHVPRPRCRMAGTVPRSPPPRHGGFFLGVCSPSVSRALGSGWGPVRTTLFTGCWSPLSSPFLPATPRTSPWAWSSTGHTRPPVNAASHPQLQADNRSSGATTGRGNKTLGV